MDLTQVIKSKQGQIALIIGMGYIVTLTILGLGVVPILAAMMQMIILAYIVNCIIIGDCQVLGWVYIALISLSCVGNILILAEVKRRSSLSS